MPAGPPPFSPVLQPRTSDLLSGSDPPWVEAVATLILRSGEKHFRWHDSGDLQGVWHLRKIIAVCRWYPAVRFWLPTREHQTVEAYRRLGDGIPENLCIRYSAHLVDGPPRSATDCR